MFEISKKLLLNTAIFAFFYQTGDADELQKGIFKLLTPPIFGYRWAAYNLVPRAFGNEVAPLRVEILAMLNNTLNFSTLFRTKDKMHAVLPSISN